MQFKARVHFSLSIKSTNSRITSTELSANSVFIVLCYGIPKEQEFSRMTEKSKCNQNNIGYIPVCLIRISIFGQSYSYILTFFGKHGIIVWMKYTYKMDPNHNILKLHYFRYTVRQ